MTVPINFVSSSRSRRVSIVINSSTEVTVRVPFGLSERRAKEFVEAKRDWIERTVAKMRKREEKYRDTIRLPKGNRGDLLRYRAEVGRLVRERLEFFNREVYGGRFAWKRVTIRNTKTRWGSCSKRTNLNFSYRIVLLPKELADYLVVHELCHLGEFNHSKKFWDLVAVAVPDFKRLRKELRRIS